MAFPRQLPQLRIRMQWSQFAALLDNLDTESTDCIWIWVNETSMYTNVMTKKVTRRTTCISNTKRNDTAWAKITVSIGDMSYRT